MSQDVTAHCCDQASDVTARVWVCVRNVSSYRSTGSSANLTYVTHNIPQSVPSDSALVAH
jgi:hypothetical protein